MDAREMVPEFLKRKFTKPNSFFYFNRKEKDGSPYQLKLVPAIERESEFWICSPFGVAHYTGDATKSRHPGVIHGSKLKGGINGMMEAFTLAEWCRHAAIYDLLKARLKFYSAFEICFFFVENANF